MHSAKIVLASTSVFRQALLKKLHLPFSIAKPAIDEFIQPNESVEDMVNRLSLAKGVAIAKEVNNKIIIASDQAACFNNKAIGKPLNYANATKQLQEFSGQTVTFFTGLAVIDQASQKTFQAMDTTKVTFRNLTKTDIHNYLSIEEPFQCAGSFKSEGLGITLFEKVETTDPNALIGLPLIELTSILKQIGLQIPPEKSQKP